MVLLGAFLQQELQSNSCCRLRMNQILIFSFFRRALLIFPLTDNPSSFWNFFMAFLVFFAKNSICLSAFISKFVQFLLNFFDC